MDTPIEHVVGDWVLRNQPSVLAAYRALMLMELRAYPPNKMLNHLEVWKKELDDPDNQDPQVQQVLKDTIEVFPILLNHYIKTRKYETPQS